jgi:PAS domain S-box-containing protein
MHTYIAMADEMLQTAVKAVYHGDEVLLQTLDELPAAIYVTCAKGVITHYNRACIAFAGRTPRIGQDNWCVTWKLYTEDGQFLPHDRCPMAFAIRERRAVRGIEAVAERPDGTRVSFRPYPTPLLDEAGNLIGAVNLLMDVTARKQAQARRAQAVRCRLLANLAGDEQTTRSLASMAAEYDDEALKYDAKALLMEHGTKQKLSASSCQSTAVPSLPTKSSRQGGVCTVFFPQHTAKQRAPDASI